MLVSVLSGSGEVFRGSVYDHMTAEQTNPADPEGLTPAAASKPPWSDLLSRIETIRRMQRWSQSDRNIQQVQSLIVTDICTKTLSIEKWNWGSDTDEACSPAESWTELQCHCAEGKEAEALFWCLLSTCSLKHQIMLLETRRSHPVSVFHVVTIALLQASYSNEISLIIIIIVM